MILSFQWVHDVWWIGALRIALQVAQAALLTTIAVFAARIAPAGRSAEALAMIGVGGLAGMMVGPVIGDAMFARLGETASVYAMYFTVGAGLMAATVIMVSFMPALRLDPDLGGGRESFLKLVVHHWAGTDHRARAMSGAGTDGANAVHRAVRGGSGAGGA